MRLFVAVWPDAAVAAVLRTLADELRAGFDGLLGTEESARSLAWVRAEQWHVTLRFLGEQPDDDGPAAALRHLEASWPTRSALIGTGAELHGSGDVLAGAGPAPTWLGRRVLCVPVSGLDGLARATASVLDEAGVAFDRTPAAFSGHLTLARWRRRRRPPGLPPPPISATWTIGEVTLVRSGRQDGRAVYDVRGRARLVRS